MRGGLKWEVKKEPSEQRLVLYCDAAGCKFRAKSKELLRQHRIAVHGIGSQEAGQKKRKAADTGARATFGKQGAPLVMQPMTVCGVAGCDYKITGKLVLLQHRKRISASRARPSSRRSGRSSPPTSPAARASAPPCS